MKEIESQIVSAICDYLAARHHFFFRANNMPAVQKSADGWAFRRMPKHAMKGVPDIILIKRPTGQFVGLEVKTSTGRLSPEQVDFAQAAKTAGAFYHVVRSIDDVQMLGL